MVPKRLARIASFAGLSLGFRLNAFWTFNFTGSKVGAAAGYGFVIAIAYLSNLAIVMISIRVLSIDSYISQVLGVGPYFWWGPG